MWRSCCRRRQPSTGTRKRCCHRRHHDTSSIHHSQASPSYSSMRRRKRRPGHRGSGRWSPRIPVGARALPNTHETRSILTAFPAMPAIRKGRALNRESSFPSKTQVRRRSTISGKRLRAVGRCHRGLSDPSRRATVPAAATTAVRHATAGSFCLLVPSLST